MRLVLDASVWVKWLFNDPEREPLTDEATALVAAVIERGAMLQPVHWLAEVGAALARKTPETAERNLFLLDALECETLGGIEVIQRACRLSIELNHHLFDTLYHAVALETDDAMLITADGRYLNRAEPVGRILALERWSEVLK